MNDFYEPRRTIITDVAGLVGMALAGAASSALVWETLAAGFKTGRLEQAFFVFLTVVLGAAAVGGLAGLAIGRGIANRWERRHRSRRPPPRPDDGPRAEATAPRATTSIAGINLAGLGVDVPALMSLRQRCGFTDAPHTADLLRRTTNIGAWEGERLVGVVRLVSDGRAGIVSDLLVDPTWRRRGIGRALLAAAREAIPSGRLVIVEPPVQAEGFLRAMGMAPRDAWTSAPD